ncbi:MAG: tyrosine--tRNA ligase [Deltaproteobacteria bacterium]|jgi:tyrosyl-tRNA synthetase|nr:tyrosine--tRNA ligase [Deltaproteobacteria bacterium]
MGFHNTYRLLRDRGFTYQTTGETVLEDLFSRETVTAYIGFDVTADSLHVGHLLPLMALSWLDKTGHRPIALVGGGTSMVGDPSGRSQARQLMTLEAIQANQEGIRPQMARFLTLEPQGRALLINNKDWLLDLNYVTFLRDIGRHFSVNRMLTAECYKSRLETGLSFLEFNYMLMQAYDFLTLYEQKGNKLQLGGQDQWGNIVAGVELIRRVNGGDAYGITMPLLIDPRTGDKFGKTNAGAVWLSAERTSVFDFYQFWRNIDDQETGRLLSLFTFLPLDECQSLARGQGSLINRAKEILAYEVTALCHGHEAAAEAFLASVRAFGAADPDGEVKTSSKLSQLTAGDLAANLPTVALPGPEAAEMDLAQLFVRADLASSKGEARRLIRQGGAYADNAVIDPTAENSPAGSFPWFKDGRVTLRAGKKRYKIVKFMEAV